MLSLLALCAAFLPLAAGAQSPSVDTGEYLRQLREITDSSGVPPRARAADFLRELREASGAPEISVAVVRRGRIVFSRGVGVAELAHQARATPTTVYNLGSISKAVTAVAVMQLVEDGEVDLDDPIRQYVPAFPEKRGPVTIRHLMTHTSGIRHYRPNDFDRGTRCDNVGTFGTLEEAIGIFAEDALLFEPGAFYHYSSYAVNLLQGVVESATGLGFEEALRERVWSPAGMRSTAFDRPGRIVSNRARGHEIVDGHVRLRHPEENVTYKFASGGMIGSVEDLARFGAAILEGRLLDPATVDLMFAPRLQGVLQFGEGDEPTPLRWRQALMWRIRSDEVGRDYVHHCGSVKGFATCLLIYPDEGLVVATADNANVLNLRAGRALADFFREGDGGTPRDGSAAGEGAGVDSGPAMRNH